jgi:hypothetical protein
VVRDWSRANPATTILWVLVALHVWMLAGLTAPLRQSVLLAHSTNLSELRRDPITVLVASAMWTDIGDLGFLTVMAICVLAPAERWLGSTRMVVVFVVGHIGATLVTAVWLNALINDHVVARSESHAVDVGVSYGVYCVMTVLCYRLRVYWRVPALALLASYLVIELYRNRTFTDFGHVMAMSFGLLLYPITVAKDVRDRRGTPWIAVPLPDLRVERELTKV